MHADASIIWSAVRFWVGVVSGSDAVVALAVSRLLRAVLLWAVQSLPLEAAFLLSIGSEHNLVRKCVGVSWHVPQASLMVVYWVWSSGIAGPTEVTITRWVFPAGSQCVAMSPADG